MQKTPLFAFAFLVGCGDAAPVEPPAPAETAAPPLDQPPPAADQAFSCTCALHAPDAEAAATGKCSLTVHGDGKAEFSGETADAPPAKLTGNWTVVPVPEGRVEPEPFPAFRGDLVVTVEGKAQSHPVDVTFVDNLMYEITLPMAEPAQALALVCSPP